MKNAILFLFCLAISLAFNVAKADSWSDFQASMNTNSVSNGVGYSMSNGMFSASSGAGDTTGYGGYSVDGGLNTGVYGTGSSNSNVGTVVRADVGPFGTSVSAISRADTQTAAGLGSYAGGNAGITTNVWSGSFGALPPPPSVPVPAPAPVPME